MKKLNILLALLVAMLGLTYVTVYIFQNNLLFHPNYQPAKDFQLRQNGLVEEVTLNGPDGVLHGWIKKASFQPAPTILFYGGNTMSAAATLHDMTSWDRENRLADCNFIMIDYPGYGRSLGKPSDTSLYAMALASFDQVRARPDVGDLYIMGFSLGSGPAIYAAAQRESAGLILLAPFDNGEHLFNQFLSIFHGPFAAVIKNKFPSDTFASSITEKTVVFITTGDHVIYNSLSLRLLQHFSTPPTLITVPDISHNRLFFSYPPVMQAISAFIHDRNKS